MSSTFLGLNLSDWGSIATITSLITPTVAVIWFIRSYSREKSIEIYKSLIGNYAGFNEESAFENGVGGILVNIFDYNTNGYLRGEFYFKDYDKEMPLRSSAGYFSFYIKMNKYDLFSLKGGGSPIDFNRSLITTGKLFIIERFEIAHHLVHSSNFITHELNLTHYREVNFIELELEKILKPQILDLPNKIRLYPKLQYQYRENLYDGIEKQLNDSEKLSPK